MARCAWPPRCSGWTPWFTATGASSSRRSTSSNATASSSSSPSVSPSSSSARRRQPRARRRARARRAPRAGAQRLSLVAVLLRRGRGRARDARRTPERRPRLALIAFGYWHYGLAARHRRGGGRSQEGGRQSVRPLDSLIAIELAAGVALFVACEVGFRRTLGLGAERDQACCRGGGARDDSARHRAGRGCSGGSPGGDRCDRARRRGLPTCASVVTAVVVESELGRMRTQPDGIDLVLALPGDPGGDQLRREDVAREQELVVGLERLQRSGSEPGTCGTSAPASSKRS